MEEKLLTLYAATKRQEARFQMYAVRAQKDERPEMVYLFNALALSYKSQANRILLQIRGFITDTNNNSANAKDKELPQIIRQHQQLEKLAESHNKAIYTGSKHATKINNMNTNLLNQVETGKKPESYNVCDFCGFISKNKIPEKCPICTAAPHRFIEAMK